MYETDSDIENQNLLDNYDDHNYQDDNQDNNQFMGHDHAIREFMQHSDKYEIAITGKAFYIMLDNSNKGEVIAGYDWNDIFSKILTRGKVFARMSPKQKAMLIEEIKDETERIVWMWGDGANDWVALKTADVGVSLSEAEASVAAPFTSKEPDISSVAWLLRHGRASLELSYILFKYVLIVHSIKFTTLIILGFFTWTLYDWEFSFINFVLEYPTYVLVWRTQTADVLGKRVPFRSLLTRPIVTLILGYAIIQAGGQIGMYFLLKGQDFYHHTHGTHRWKARRIEVTTLFMYSCALHVIPTIIIEWYSEFRKPFYTNYPLWVSLLIQFAWSVWIWVFPLHFMRRFFHMVHIHEDWFRWVILFCSFFTILIFFIWEMGVHYTLGHSQSMKDAIKQKDES